MERQLELKTSGDDEIDSPEIPVLVNGEAQAPKRRGRPPGSKTKHKTAPPSLGEVQTQGVGSAFKSKKTSKVTLNLADVMGPEMLSSAARAPIMLGDMAVTIASKGRLNPIKYIPPGPIHAVDDFFKENVVKGAGIELEMHPLTGWMMLCGFALLSGVIGQTAEYALSIKAQAGALPQRQDAKPDINGQAGIEAPSPGVEAVSEFSGSGSTPSA